jgi:hypothetical protein
MPASNRFQIPEPTYLDERWGKETFEKQSADNKPILEEMIKRIRQWKCMECGSMNEYSPGAGDNTTLRCMGCGKDVIGAMPAQKEYGREQGGQARNVVSSGETVSGQGGVVSCADEGSSAWATE